MDGTQMPREGEGQAVEKTKWVVRGSRRRTITKNIVNKVQKDSVLQETKGQESWDH